jgi:hypothetical protein
LVDIWEELLTSAKNLRMEFELGVQIAAIAELRACSKSGTLISLQTGRFVLSGIGGRDVCNT